MIRATITLLLLLAMAAQATERTTPVERREAELIRKACAVQLITTESALIACRMVATGLGGQQRYSCRDVPSGALLEAGESLYVRR